MIYEMIYSSIYTNHFLKLYNGERKAKSDLIFHALGHQDELNAILGIYHCINYMMYVLI